MDINYAITARQRLVNLCIAQNPGLGLTGSEITFSPPLRNIQNEKNTRVTVTYSTTFLYLPSTVLHYDRQDAQELFLTLHDSLSLDLPNPTTTHAALSAVLAQYGVAIEASEIEDLPIVNDTLSLKFLPTSLGMTGTVSFLIGAEPAGDNFRMDNDDTFALDNGDTFQLD